MVMKNKICMLTAALLTAANLVGAANGDFDLQCNNGSIIVHFRGNKIIDGSYFLINGQPVKDEFHHSSSVAGDGSKVYNSWSKNPELPFRQEAVISADRSQIEITFQAMAYANGPHCGKILYYKLPMPFSAFVNRPYAGLIGRTTNVVDVSGKVPENLRGDLTATQARCLAFELPQGSLFMDFNPLGATTFFDRTINQIAGQWNVAKLGNDKDMSAFAAVRVPAWGGALNGKLVLRSAGMKDFEQFHTCKKYHYYDLTPAQRLYSFGAEQVGKQYRKMDLQAFSPAAEAGWLNSGDARKLTGKHGGAFYSAVAGTQAAAFKVSGLKPGCYMITAGLSNAVNDPNNSTTLKINDQLIFKDLQLKNNEAAAASRAIWLDSGEATLEFSGNWQLSTLGFQRLLASAEDYSFRRGFWKTAGFEPVPFFGNASYAGEPAYSTGISRFVLPEPGKEMPVKIKTWVYESVKPLQVENMDWRYQAVFGNLGPGNCGYFYEFRTQEALEKRLDEMKSSNINVIMVNGMLSRHTYPAHEANARQQLRRYTDAAHARGMKVIDHQDYVLLWNMDSGLRVAAANVDYLTRDSVTNLPSTVFCVNNPERNQKYIQWLLKWIEDTNIDGVMIDEANYSKPSCCGCTYCREDFYRETGCRWPVSELSGELAVGRVKAVSQLNKIWNAWRMKRVGDWWVALRKAVNARYPSFSFLCYTTHYGLVDNYAPNYLGSCLLQIGRAADFLGTEIMSRNVHSCWRAIMAYRRAKNMFKVAYDIPIYGLVYAYGDNAWDMLYFGWALNNMNGQITWAESMKCPPGKSNFYLFGDRNMDLKQARMISKTAVIFSTQGRDNESIMSYRGELFGLAQTLEAMHIPYEIIADKTLPQLDLNKYRVIFAGASGALSDEQSKLLKNFARNGGTLVLGPIAGVDDQYGNFRKEWAFKDVFRFQPLPRLAFTRKLAVGGKTAVELANPLIFIRNVATSRQPGSTPDENLQIVDDKGKSLPLRYTANYGKGKIIYIPAALGQPLAELECAAFSKYQFDPDKALDSFYKNLLRNIVQDAQAEVWTVEAPENIPATLFQQPDGCYAHFLNAGGSNYKKGDLVTFNFPKEPFPMLKKDIVFTLHDLKVNIAEAASPDFSGWKKLPLEKDAQGRSKVTLPKELLKIYTVVRLR